MFDTTQNTLRRAIDLPAEDNFANPSTLMFGKKLFAVGNTNNIYKHSIGQDKWEIIHKFI